MKYTYIRTVTFSILSFLVLPLATFALSNLTVATGPDCGGAGTCTTPQQVLTNQSSLSSQPVENRVAANFLITIPAGEDVYLNNLTFTTTLDSSYSAPTGGDVFIQNQGMSAGQSGTNTGGYFDYGSLGQTKSASGGSVTVTPNLVGQTQTGTANLPANVAKLRAGNTYLITATVYNTLPAGVPKSLISPISNPHITLSGCSVTGASSGSTASCNSADSVPLKFTYPGRFIFTSIQPRTGTNGSLVSPATIKWATDLPSSETVTLELRDGNQEVNGEGTLVKTIATNVANTGSYIWSWSPSDFPTNTFYMIDLVPTNTNYPRVHSQLSGLQTISGEPIWIYINNGSAGGVGSGSQGGSSNACPVGSTMVAGVCLSSTTCPTGSSLVNGVCVQNTMCPAIDTVVNGICVAPPPIMTGLMCNPPAGYAYPNQTASSCGGLEPVGTTTPPSTSNPVTLNIPGTTAQLTSDLRLGDSGTQVTLLTQALVNDGELSTTQSTFDQTVFNAVVIYQEKYASDILTPVGLTRGNGFVGTQTRAKMNTQLLSTYNTTAGNTGGVMTTNPATGTTGTTNTSTMSNAQILTLIQQLLATVASLQVQLNALLGK